MELVQWPTAADMCLWKKTNISVWINAWTGVPVTLTRWTIRTWPVLVFFTDTSCVQIWTSHWAAEEGLTSPKHIIGHIGGRVFTGHMTDNGSDKALKEDRVLRIRLQSHQVHPTMLTVIQQLCSMKQKHTKYTQINTNKSTLSEIGPVWQNPIQRTVRTAHLSVLMTVHGFSTQYNTEQFW